MIKNLKGRSLDSRLETQDFNGPMWLSACKLVSLLIVLCLASLPVLADDYVKTWPISYQYSGEIDCPFSRSPGDHIITFNVSVTASATVKVTSPTNGTQIVNISDIGASGFSSTFAMDEIGQYEIREEYTLTLEIDLLTGTENFTRTDTRSYSNSTVGMVLFQMNDMYTDNFLSEITPSGTVKIDNVTPSTSRPGDTVSMDIIALKNISPGERIIDSMSLTADWHKTSSLTPIEDNEPPAIAHSYITEAQAGSPITAVVTDNLKVDSVFLYFDDAAPPGNNFQQIEMTLTGQPDTYAGYIPLNATDGWGKYYLKAKDVADNETTYPPSPYDILVHSIILGDVNDDDVVDDDDATMVLENTVGLTTFTSQQEILGDVSGDDTISPLDAGLIMQYEEGLRTTFPVVGGGLPSSGAVEVSVPDATGAPGGSITVPINVSNSVGGPEIIGIDVTLTYDPDILTAEDIATAGTIASGWNTDYNISNGQVIIGMANYTKLTGEGAFVNVDFSVSGTANGGEGCYLTLSNVSLNEGGVSADTTNGLFEVIDDIELVLYPGWNFFSTCFDIENNQLLLVLAEIQGLWTAVWTYDANPGWRRHIYGALGNDLHDIVPGKGYMIYMDMISNTTLTITGGQITDTTIPLQQGWNPIGIKSLVPQSPEEVSFSMPYSSIWTYDNGTWLKYIPGALGFLSDFDELEPGKAYWVYVR